MMLELIRYRDGSEEQGQQANDMIWVNTDHIITMRPFAYGTIVVLSDTKSASIEVYHHVGDLADAINNDQDFVKPWEAE